MKKLAFLFVLSGCSLGIKNGDNVLVSCDGLPMPVPAVYLKTENGSHLVETENDLALIPIQGCILIKRKSE